MADGKPEGVTDEEWAGITAWRRDQAPKRAGKLRGTDDSGAEFEIDLTPEETARLAAKHLKGLFTSDAGDGDGAEGGKKPADLRTYFGGGKKKAAGT